MVHVVRAHKQEHYCHLSRMMMKVKVSNEHGLPMNVTRCPHFKVGGHLVNCL